MEDRDCPESSFSPLKASQTQYNANMIPGIPSNAKTQEYEVEKVLRGKFMNNKLYYLIKWKGFSKSKNTWEPAENVNETLQDYLQSNPVRITGKPKV